MFCLRSVDVDGSPWCWRVSLQPRRFQRRRRAHLRAAVRQDQPHLQDLQVSNAVVHVAPPGGDFSKETMPLNKRASQEPGSSDLGNGKFDVFCAWLACPWFCSAGRRGVKRPRFVSTSSQKLFILILLALQVSHSLHCIHASSE